jgi:tight adherence protein B
VLERALMDAQVELPPEAACELGLGVTVAVGAVAASIAPGLIMAVVPCALAAGPVALRVLRRRAERRFAVALPGVLEQVATTLRGGAGLSEALAVVAASSGPLSIDLRRVTARASLGLGLAEALTTWPAARPTSPAVRAAAGALALAATVGGRSADALDGLAASLQERLGAAAEARALSSQARLSAVVVGAAPLGYLAFSVLVDPESMAALVGTPTGRVCLVLGLALELAAVAWMRRIVGEHEPW